MRSMSMRRLASLVLAFVCASFSTVLLGANSGAGNLFWDFENGSMQIYYGEKLGMTFTPEPAMEDVSVTRVLIDGKVPLVLLRGKTSSLAFVFSGGALQITGGCGINKLHVDVDAKAVVIPDALCDDDIVIPDETQRRLPSVLTHFSVLANQNDLMLNCIQVSAAGDVDFSKQGEKTRFSFNHGNGENLVFTFLTAENIWKQVDGIDGNFKDIGWMPPFPAYWTASFNWRGQRLSWPLFDLNNRDYNIKVGAHVVTNSGPTANPPTVWFSSLGFVPYPFVIDNGVPQLRLPGETYGIKPGDFKGDGIFIYPKAAIDGTPETQVFPQKWFARSARGAFKPSLVFRYPPTCSSTELVENAFVKGNLKDTLPVLHNRLNLMDIFQASIRGRIEQYMRWSEKASVLLASHPAYESTFKPWLDRFKVLYNIEIGEMKQPYDCYALSAQIHKLIDSDGDEEETEDAVKKLGRAIRVMGGGQDYCLGTVRMNAKILRMNLIRAYMNTKADPINDFILLKVYDDSSILINDYIGMEGK